MAPPHHLSELVAGLIAAQFAELCPVKVTYLGEGYDSTAFEVNASWVFRFPKRSDVERQLFLESKILPLLAPRTPVPLPSFALHGAPSPRFPRHFVGYPRLAGVPGIGLDLAHIQFDQLAPVLGAFLTSLHSFPVQTAKQVGAPEYAPEALLDEVRAEALGDLPMIGRVASGIRENELRSFLEAGVDAGHRCRSPMVVHGDLGAEHVLLDPRTHEVTGIIDWSEVSVSDPAIDFAGMFHWGERHSRKPCWRTIMERPTMGFWGGPGSSQPREAWATWSSACGSSDPNTLIRESGRSSGAWTSPVFSKGDSCEP